MSGAALLLSCTLLGATSGATSPAIQIGTPAPDVYVQNWALKPAVSLRALRGRKAIVYLYHTAC